MPEVSRFYSFWMFIHEQELNDAWSKAVNKEEFGRIEPLRQEVNMHIKNGIVYGAKPLGVRVYSVKVLEDMIMIITFSNGEIRLFDATVLEGPVYESLKNEEVFANVKISHGIITWANGSIDCSPEFMYSHSYEYIPPQHAGNVCVTGSAEQYQMQDIVDEG
ncbi:MAG: DUF2442 domain-containing protein [Clostridia bacterium]|nr:DUF2442 domain-containing protein [Clostridia bacterium]